MGEPVFAANREKNVEAKKMRDKSARKMLLNTLKGEKESADYLVSCARFTSIYLLRL